MPSSRSVGRMRKTCVIASTLESMLKCERTTPFGSPVLPLLKMIVAGSSTVGRRSGPGEPLQEPDRREPGDRQRAQPIRRGRSPPRCLRARSARRPPGSSSLAFSRKVRLVTTVRSPACRAADSIPALPDVKLRLTEARPAIDAARFTRAAATLDGSRMPTFGPSPQCGRRARASATAPARAPIPETRGRCRSAKASRAGCRRARRMNPWCSGRRSALRWAQASWSRSWIACRTAWRGVSGGSGAPNETVTGRGIRSGSGRACTGLKKLAVARSRWTGMIGVVRPLRIRCIPRWNGWIVPVRVTCPSGKMQTRCPVVECPPRLAEGLEDLLRPAAAGDRDRPHRPEQGAPQEWLSPKIAEGNRLTLFGLVSPSRRM